MRGQDEKNATSKKFALSSPDRRHTIRLIALGLSMPLVACGRAVPKYIVLDVVMYSYVDRVITDIIFNDTDLGVMNRYGSTGTIVGVGIPFGIQKLQWTLGGPKGTPRNGEVVITNGKLTISRQQIPDGTRYLGLHLYPDSTAEVTFDEFLPQRTQRGKEYRLKRAKNE
ncbi:hypothetical protein LSO07_13755 [Janthinobacterium sp. PLB04]|uniref:DUF3304 domain-containing protein n=1 Tax=Janthinobacterium lividum TaxID=29581 RepID=A0AAJ4MWC2_9BURK|nr:MULTISPECIES: hypothetical protein [Janthinobacterium]QSX98461.1 hypothetical protein J3P46_11545 [Janthinobacterium lividum]UGQ38872.1 hypothetical protein LSO07_13755 [Janthinobacterium sp. PLB04]